MSKEPWNPPKYKTTCCNSVVYSKREGEYSECSCGKVAIDQTKYYSRVIGEICNLVEIEETNV
jgi:hypothetical protein